MLEPQYTCISSLHGFQTGSS